MGTVTNCTWFATYVMSDGNTFGMSVVGNNFAVAYEEAAKLIRINGNPVQLMSLAYAGEVEYTYDESVEEEEDD